MESQPVGKRYTARCPGVPSAKRRMYSRMACSRVPSLEPIGESREMFYQQKLLLGLAWFTDVAPVLITVGGKRGVQWELKWSIPASLARRGLPNVTLQVSTVSAGSGFSFEERAHHFETLFPLGGSGSFALAALKKSKARARATIAGMRSGFMCVPSWPRRATRCTAGRRRRFLVACWTCSGSGSNAPLLGSQSSLPLALPVGEGNPGASLQGPLQSAQDGLRAPAP